MNAAVWSELMTGGQCCSGAFFGLKLSALPSMARTWCDEMQCGNQQEQKTAASWLPFVVLMVWGSDRIQINQSLSMFGRRFQAKLFIRGLHQWQRLTCCFSIRIQTLNLLAAVYGGHPGFTADIKVGSG